LGLVGYLRSKYLRQRYLTCIVYLNPHWEPSDGGCLRIFLLGDDDDRGESVVDIEPKAGRLVIFSSVNMMHAVLPTFSRRLACSMWMTINEH
jgi:SM-20-related protein